MVFFIIVMLNDPPIELVRVLEIIIIFVLVTKISLKTGKVRIQLDSIKQIVLVDSFLLLLLVAHISVTVCITQGLILYLSTKYNPEVNWLTDIHIQNRSWAIKYLYSFYWSCTTIITVGFGDIIPTNECEVMVILLVQISGSAVFGYLINIIGMTMSELK